MDRCPNCKSKRVNKVPGYQDTGNKMFYYCMRCEKEFYDNGKELPPISADGGMYNYESFGREN